MALLLVLSVAIGMGIGYWLVTRPRQKPYFATAEYWVFLPGSEMPEQDAIMTQMIAANPFSRRGKSPIGPAEGLIFSDVRLHIALVLRSKNQGVFRSEILESVTEPTPEQLEALQEAQSFVKLRFLSEERLNDRRHLQFLVHAAAAISNIGGAKLIYDRIGRRLISKEQLCQMLKENFDATIPSIHVQTCWRPLSSGGRLETCGLVKVGLEELETAVMETDQRLIASTVLEEAIAKIWSEPEIPQPLEVEAYGDMFRILLDGVKGRTARIRIMRVQAL